jgi:hypothetical protein
LYPAQVAVVAVVHAPEPLQTLAVVSMSPVHVSGAHTAVLSG